MSRSSPDREDGEAWLGKEGQIVHLEDSFQGPVGSCPLPRAAFCCSASPGPTAPLPLGGHTDKSLISCCQEARKALLGASRPGAGASCPCRRKEAWLGASCDDISSPGPLKSQVRPLVLLLARERKHRKVEVGELSLRPVTSGPLSPT